MFCFFFHTQVLCNHISVFHRTKIVVLWHFTFRLETVINDKSRTIGLHCALTRRKWSKITTKTYHVRRLSQCYTYKIKRLYFSCIDSYRLIFTELHLIKPFCSHILIFTLALYLVHIKKNNRIYDLNCKFHSSNKYLRCSART